MGRKRRTHEKARQGERQIGANICLPSGRKVRFHSRKAALTKINSIRARHAGPPLRVYHCEHCGDWHSTSQPARGSIRG